MKSFFTIIDKLFEDITGPIKSMFNVWIKDATISGILLVICAIVAFIWSNIAHISYEQFWENHFEIGIAGFSLNGTIHFWINDFLMAIFFFLIGLEIKRNILEGELKNWRNASLPVYAALGGMIVPAILFYILNKDSNAANGWGIPMATDIAFSMAVLALLRTRAPISLKLFLSVFAIVDDIGAVIVIAIFYTDTINLTQIIVSGLLLASMITASIKLHIKSAWFFGTMAALVWLSVLTSGIHTSIAGVLIAMTIPLNMRVNKAAFATNVQNILNSFKKESLNDKTSESDILSDEQNEHLKQLKTAASNITSPLIQLEHNLLPIVSFIIIPLFAISNAGVYLGHNLSENIFNNVSIGIILGLVLGKQIGIFGCVWIAVRLGLASLPPSIRWIHIYGVSWLGGIGFTMSLFIISLALTDEQSIVQAKIGVVIGSIIAGIGGYLILRLASPKKEPSPEPTKTIQ